MNNPVSGESSARGQGPHIAVGPAAVAIRRPELWNAWNVAVHGTARLGLAGQEHGKEYGMARQGLEGRAWLGMEYGKARHGAARPGAARRGKELGLA